MTDTLDPLGGPIRHLKRINPPWSARSSKESRMTADDTAAPRDFLAATQGIHDPQDLRAALTGEET